jgi:ABC-2 type transport system ATP-binding protein
MLSAKFHEAPSPLPEMAGVEVLKRNGYAVRLKVDTERTNIDVVTAAILQAGRVADITIEDPPLEDVIAHIYSQQASHSQEYANGRR